MESDGRLRLRWEAKANPAGFALNHHYIDVAYLPVLGPSCVAVLRRLAALQLAFPKATEVGTAEFARQLGLGGPVEPAASFWRALRRLDHFELVTWDADASTLTAPYRVPPVSGRLLDRLPATSRAAHDGLIRIHPPLQPRPPTRPTPSTGLGL